MSLYSESGYAIEKDGSMLVVRYPSGQQAPVKTVEEGKYLITFILTGKDPNRKYTRYENGRSKALAAIQNLASRVGVRLENKNQFYDAGRRARKAGKPKEACPYSDKSPMGRDWVDGWDDPEGKNKGDYE